MKATIIKYNAGNILSVRHALSRLGWESEVTGDHKKIRNARKVIFPGVGEASTTMKFLSESGLDELIPRLKMPVLGICLGLQLMCRESEEGNVPCLDIFPARVRRFKGNEKIPHMGWNMIKDLKGDLFRGIEEGSYVYFVHSYYAEMSVYSAAVCHYMIPFSAALQKDNFFALQFHPEKSGAPGEIILKNFLEL